MSKQTESNTYTILFVIGMVIAVGTLLSSVFWFTKDPIKENQRVEKKQNILFAMGVTEEGSESSFVPSSEANELFDKYITKQYILENGEYAENDSAYLIDLKKELQKEKEGKSFKKPFFVGSKNGKDLYIIPVRGNGLWDAIWGYIALDREMVIQGTYFDHKGETPGLGAEIKAKYFQDRFLGEHILNSKGEFEGVTVLKGNNDPQNSDKQDNEIDALSGATITGDGVTKMIQSGVGPYVPYLAKLK